MMFLLLVFTFSGSVLAEEHQAYASQGNVAFSKRMTKLDCNQQMGLFCMPLSLMAQATLTRTGDGPNIYV